FASEAALKSDGNLSINGGERVEIKNITGTKEIERALNYEHIRQKNVVRGGGVITLESRQWNPQLGVTKTMRKKETEADYGYTFEPDLTKIEIKKSLIDKLKKGLPELPDQRQKRFIKEYGMHEKEAEKLTSEKAISDIFEKAAKKVGAKIAAGWISGPLKKTLNYNDTTYIGSGLKDEWIISLLSSFAKKDYTDHVTEQIIRKMVELKKDDKSVAKTLGLGKIEDKGKIKDIVKKVIETNEVAVNDYKSGNEKSLHFLVGQVMRATKGQIDANTAKKEILLELK
ncbi:MAG: Asp-tRNA(Asn)/Glu-tRNA(Gln) amidotransferase GatCAB subunit B, partial [Candidatus Aenigmarchaeota archaeon]|nr:Asp-tRNA(Asn)/Glu-tRNA(Gln) amidotransferase GatCAB subunit B [Candidatus Aenigmarchaeota archaeon]